MMTPTDKPTQVGGLLPEPVAYANKLQLLGVLSADSAILGRNVLMSRSKTIKRTEPMFSADQMKANVQALEARLVALIGEEMKSWGNANERDRQIARMALSCLKGRIDAALREGKP